SQESAEVAVSGSKTTRARPALAATRSMWAAGWTSASSSSAAARAPRWTRSRASPRWSSSTRRRSGRSGWPRPGSCASMRRSTTTAVPPAIAADDSRGVARGELTPRILFLTLARDVRDRDARAPRDPGGRARGARSEAAAGGGAHAGQDAGRVPPSDRRHRGRVPGPGALRVPAPPARRGPPRPGARHRHRRDRGVLHQAQGLVHRRRLPGEPDHLLPGLALRGARALRPREAPRPPLRGGGLVLLRGRRLLLLLARLPGRLPLLPRRVSVDQRRAPDPHQRVPDLREPHAARLRHHLRAAGGDLLPRPRGGGDPSHAPRHVALRDRRHLHRGRRADAGARCRLAAPHGDAAPRALLA